MDMNIQSVINQFESTVSDNRHVLEQFVDMDFSSTLYVPIAIETVRAGTIRAQIVDRIVDPNDPGAADFERLVIVDRPANTEAAQAAIFVLGNADDKVISTGGTGDRFEFVPQGYKGSDDVLLADQSFGNDVIVDLSRRDPEFSQTDDVIFLKGVTSVDELVMTRTALGREGNTSLKIQTDIESSGNINDGEITVFKQFDPLVKRFAIEKLEIETLSGEVQLWSLPTVSAIRDGRRIIDKVIETDIGDTGRAIFIGNDSEVSNFKLTNEPSGDGQAFGGLTNFDIKIINWKDGDTVDLSSIGLASDYSITAGVLLSSGGGESFILDENGKFSVTNPDYTFINSLQSGDLYTDGYAASVNELGGILVEVDTDVNYTLVASGTTLAGTSGHDQLSLKGSGIVASSTLSIEELIFDGVESEVIVRATGMASLNTLTFSGQGTNAPAIRGLGDQALTVNAILESTWDNLQVISGAGALTVNLNGNPDLVALQQKSDNDFDFKATTNEDVSINIGPYVSASGTYNLNNVDGTVSVFIDPVSTFGSHIMASGAETISIVGDGKIAATVSAESAKTINVDVGSGTLVIGSSAATTFNLSSDGGIVIDTGWNRGLSLLQTMSIDTNHGTADLSSLNLDFRDMRNLTMSGAGSNSSVLLNRISGSGNAMTMSLSGLEGGVSAHSVTNNSGSMTISAESMTGKLNISDLKVSGEGNLTVSTGAGLSANT